MWRNSDRFGAPRPTRVFELGHVDHLGERLARPFCAALLPHSEQNALRCCRMLIKSSQRPVTSTGTPAASVGQLNVAASPHNIDWRWVRGHAGDPGNERADALANAGAAEFASHR